MGVIVITAMALTLSLRGTGGSETVVPQKHPVEQVAEPENTGVNTAAEEIDIKPLQHSLDAADSLWLVVNKDRPISLEYVPIELREVDVARREDKSKLELSMRDDAATALETLFAAAEVDGLHLLLGSGYRSADLQNTYYTSYVAAYGQEDADKFSARPGTSEHQTGLVADVSPKSRNCYLEICFADTPEGKWVKDNAHNYGFVVRYPEGKEAITGYQFEPWHLRFVGEDLAQDLYDASQTLEEFFDLLPS